MEQIKFIPKGVSNFRELREKNRYYVDKTLFLPKLERVGDFLFLTRPRRFGKSLFLSMMKDYYDINNKDNFQKEFEGLYIANNPTELQGYFQVLYFDFAMLGGGTGDLEKKFDEYCKKRIQNFLKYYSSFYPRGFAKEVAEIDTLSVQIDYIAETARNSGYHLYLIIDEYDNFTNNMLYGNSESKDKFSKTTHGDGFYRQVFQSFKPSFERIIMFGVLPITLMDPTNCFNISTNISFLKNYNTMLGFSEKDVKDIIRYYRKAKLIKMKEKDILADLKPWYDGYCFSKDCLKNGQGMYNPNNVLSYLNILIETGNPPASLIDPNTAMEFNKLRKMVDIDNRNNANSIINKIVSDGYTTDELFEEFDADKIEKKEYLPSLMYYYGMLTIGEVDDDELKLVIPNRNMVTTLPHITSKGAEPLKMEEIKKFDV